MDLDALHSHVTGLLAFKKRLEAMIEGSGAGSSVAEMLNAEIDSVRVSVTDLADHVATIQQFKDEVSPLLEGLAGLQDMAQWFAENRDGLEVLLSFGGELKTAADVNPGAITITGPTATAPLTLDQVNATSKPQMPPVDVLEVVSETAAAAPAVDPAPAANQPPADPLPEATSSGESGA